MEVFHLEESPADRFMELDVPRDPKKSQIDQWKDELIVYFQVMKDFRNMDAEEIFLSLSAFSARASEMRSMLVRDTSKRSQSFRTQEVDPFIEECDRQFKFHSRAQAIREMEVRIAGGAFT